MLHWLPKLGYKCLRFLFLIWLCCLLLGLAQLWYIYNYQSALPAGGHKYHKWKRSLQENEAILQFVDQQPACCQAIPFAYNVSQSNRVGAYRLVPDTRHDNCKKSHVDLANARQKVSVVIAFHNEARSTLLRTINSLYHRTPPSQLHEIILIDDFSEDEHLLEHLRKLNFPPFSYNQQNKQEELMAGTQQGGANAGEPEDDKDSENEEENPYAFGSMTLSMTTIKMQRNPCRLGLIESRNRGALTATGDYLLFLDSHCEVNVGWLEPLLARMISTSIRSDIIAVSPVLDIIDTNSLKYRSGSASLMGAFDWNLHFHWLPRHLKSSPDSPQTHQPFKSPAFAGGIFLISRNNFFKLNAFNPLLQIWGGESIEFSIKVWLCGGHIEIVPCSRIGHIFFKSHPFTFQQATASDRAIAGITDIDGQATYLRNSKVIAEAWLDHHKYFFYTSKPEAKDVPFDRSSLDGLFQMKKDFKCHPFSWYRRNVFPELRLPSDEFMAYGTLSMNDQCVHIKDASNSSLNSQLCSQLHMSSCYGNDVTHWFLHRANAHLHSNNGICLSVASAQANQPRQSKPSKLIQVMNKVSNSVIGLPNAPHGHFQSPGPRQFSLTLEYCDTSSRAQRWHRQGPLLIHEQTQLCLDNPVADLLTLSVCRNIAPSQYFRFSIELQRQ